MRDTSTEGMRILFAGGKADGQTRILYGALTKYLWVLDFGMAVSDHRSSKEQERYVLAGGDEECALYICTGDSPDFVPTPDC